MREYPGELFDRIFRYERIDGRCATERYLHRWTLLRLPGGRAVYLHHFVGSDWVRDLHDHPKAFLSIGLRGGYVEERPANAVYPNAFGPIRCGGRRYSERHSRTRYVAPWIRRFGPHHVHRLRIPPGGSCWTLVWVGRQEREWGFWRQGRWIRWDRYVRRFGGQDGC